MNRDETLARAYLESLQSQYYAKMGIDPNEWYSSQDFKVFMKGVSERLSGIDRGMSAEDAKRLRDDPAGTLWEFLPKTTDLPTSFEDRLGFWLLSQLLDSVEAAARRQPAKLPPRPVIGTLPTGRLNAAAIQLNHSGVPIIIFESGLPTFILRSTDIAVNRGVAVDATVAVGPTGTAVRAAVGAAAAG